MLGAVTSFARAGMDIECTSCDPFFPNDDPVLVHAFGPETTLRIGWGEEGPESEGWYPWWSGYVYLR